MSENTLIRVVEYLLDEVRDLKAEVSFYRAAGNDRQRLLDRNAIDQRAEGGLKNLSPEEIVAALKGFGNGTATANYTVNPPSD